MINTNILYSKRCNYNKWCSCNTHCHFKVFEVNLCNRRKFNSEVPLCMKGASDCYRAERQTHTHLTQIMPGSALPQSHWPSTGPLGQWHSLRVKKHSDTNHDPYMINYENINYVRNESTIALFKNVLCWI